MNKIDLSIGVKRLSGVGESRAKTLGSLRITDLQTLLYHFPRAYEYRGNVKTLASSQDGEYASFILTVASPGVSTRAKNNISLTKFLTYDDTAKCTVVYFNQGYIKDTLKTGCVYRFYGKMVKFGRQYELVNPKAELYINEKNEKKELDSLYAVYPACEGISSRQIYNIISRTFEYIDGLVGCEIEETLPADVIEKYSLLDRYTALKNIHCPSDFTSLNEAKRRLAFEEIYMFAQRIANRKKEGRAKKEFVIQKCDMTPFVKRLPYELTGAQKRTINEIYSDMVGINGTAMRRIVSGDVGSGKTICAAAAVYIAVKSGKQAALMVPTELLARQHYNDLSELFAPLGITTALLTSDTTKSEKERIYKSLKEGIINFIIGTHALITDKVEFSSLGLTICDEQHRFGVNQRKALVDKGVGVHSLVMSATPIPRTLALVLFGDLDVSAVDELPAGRQKVTTCVVDERYRKRMYGFIRNQISEGRQVYIVCPEATEREEGEIPIEAFDSAQALEKFEKDTKKRAAAISYAENLGQTVFPDLRVKYVHGKMKATEKSQIMREFERGGVDILVSTTVIEVGINVPNATMMVVENAECFGLSQLHQLRGRVGRGKHKSYCILVSSSSADIASERLDIMKKTSDGYKIAEFDLKLRGPGDFLKNSAGQIRQHGDLQLKLGTVLTDIKLLYDAFEAAKAHSEI